MAIRHDVLAWTGFGLVLGGVVWLGPLMLDQMTFFGDRNQEAAASAARSLMPWPTMLVAAGAVIVAIGGRPLHGAVAALPLVAVALAWAAPDALYQLVAFGITAPIAAGTALAATLPLEAAPRPVIVVPIAIVALAALLATPLLAGLAIVTLLAWWELSRRARRAGRSSALD
jgi:hypothetical protein